jgi:hypothetical protein
MERRGAASVPKQPVDGSHLHRSGREPSPELRRRQPAGKRAHRSGRERYDHLQSDEQPNHPARSAGIRRRPAGHLLRRVPAAAGAESVCRGDP